LLLKSFFKELLRQSKELIAQYWIVPLDSFLPEIVGLNKSSYWYMLSTLLAWIRDLGRLLYTSFRVNISRWDSSEWSIIYISDDTTSSVEELQYLLCPGVLTETKLGRVFVWQLSRLVPQFTAQGYLIVCDLNRLIKLQFQGTYCIRIFPWLRTLLDVSGSMDSVLKRMTRHRRQDLTKVKKLDFRYRLSQAPADFDLFYNRMHVPFITERYQDRAIIPPAAVQRKLFEKRGKLLCVEYEATSTAACMGILRRYNKTFSAVQLGIDQDQSHMLKEGVIVALYWQIISWAHANGLHFVDFGRTRARVSDGLFLFKHRWGMQFERDLVTPTMWTFIGKNLPLPLIRHLNDLAFIAEVKHEQHCVIFADDRVSLSCQELAQKEKVIAQAGLNGLLFLRLHNEEKKFESMSGVKTAL
jgi:hypothetical protein